MDREQSERYSTRGKLIIIIVVKEAKGGEVKQRGRAAWLARGWNALMHAIHGNTPGNFAKRIADKNKGAEIGRAHV